MNLLRSPRLSSYGMLAVVALALGLAPSALAAHRSLKPSGYGCHRGCSCHGDHHGQHRYGDDRGRLHGTPLSYYRGYGYRHRPTSFRYRYGAYGRGHGASGRHAYSHRYGSSRGSSFRQRYGRGYGASARPFRSHGRYRSAHHRRYGRSCR